jgi:hypothetical protein
MKKYVLIFCKTKYSLTPYDQWLKSTDLTPVILLSNEVHADYLHIENTYAFENYDKNAAVEDRAIELAKLFTFAAVFARAESDIMRAAKVREILKIKGQNVESARSFRDKVVMKNYLKDSPIILPKYQTIISKEDTRQFIQSHGFPVVIKPCLESGSMGVSIIHSWNDFDMAWGDHLLEHWEVESFVDGKMYHVDGLIIEGRIVFVRPFKYINDCLSFRKNLFVGSCSVMSDDLLYSRLIKAAETIVTTLPTPKNTAFHCELWVRPGGDIVFCEIASRTGGGMISKMIEVAYEISLDKEWLLAEVGLGNELSKFPFCSIGSINIPPQVGRLDFYPENCELPYVKYQQVHGQVGQVFQGGVKSGLFLFGFVLAGENEEMITHRMQAINDWASDQVKWTTV